MERVDRFLNEQVREGRTPGLSYAHFDAGQVLYGRVAGFADVASQQPVTSATTFHLFSTTKTLTALAVLQLVEQGKLALDDRVKDHLPSFAYPGPIAVRHLLSHTAGLPNPMPLNWIHGAEAHAGFDRDRFFADVFRAHPAVQRAPGERFAYSNLGYVVLGQVIERRTGQRYEEVIRQRILEPSGIGPHELAFVVPQKADHATGYVRWPSLMELLLGFFLNKKEYLGPRVGRWKPFKPLLVNGTPYGGGIGNVHGVMKYAQALLRDDALLSAPLKRQLFEEARTNNGRPTGMCLSWFKGQCNGQEYFAHAGGGGGYYCELRLYPQTGRGSLILTNRTGVRDERLLDKVDVLVLG